MRSRLVVLPVRGVLQSRVQKVLGRTREVSPALALASRRPLGKARPRLARRAHGKPVLPTASYAPVCERLGCLAGDPIRRGDLLHRWGGTGLDGRSVGTECNHPPQPSAKHEPIDRAFLQQSNAVMICPLAHLPTSKLRDDEAAMKRQ
jgi:hypothetical protein